ncbi:peptidoglycan-binding domain-containing protein [Streptomyces luteogriseus]|uniref:peptidoglycan-binding domain-containing protein n=1 Tax=Streptomyces luteogriseus TaxID=68233 RepID=UPI00262546AD|nr:peptidoglycan-binding domain-containing protein [uncultured Streptomyces sp.]
MKMTRALRSKAGISTAAILLSCAGIGMTTATPAAAYAGYCNADVEKKRPAASGGSYKAVLPARGSNVDCYMNQGAEGDAVKALQKNLNWCYGRNLDVDGIFGKDTREALEYAQAQEKIGKDGKYGELSRTHLEWRWYENRNLWYCGRL